MACALKSAAIIYANALLAGAVLMGFEVLGSRYLYPYFGGGIDTWAGLIATALCALAAGAFAGGWLADRYPTPRVLAYATALAAAYMAMVPFAADTVLPWALSTLGMGLSGILFGAGALLLLPLVFLGMLSPVAIRLLTHEATQVGHVAGRVYSVGTLGSVIGTLLTAFALIPMMGSRDITGLYAVVLAMSALSLLCAVKRET